MSSRIGVFTGPELPVLFRLCSRNMSEIYKNEIGKVFGKGNCVALRIRNDGAVKVI